jgi:hypothetical protein
MDRDHFSRRIQWWLFQELIYAFFGRWRVLYMDRDCFSRRIQWWLFREQGLFFNLWLFRELIFFLEVESVIYRQGLFFKENSVVAVSGADLCLFWNVESVIYGQGLFFKENSVVAVSGANLCFFFGR